MVGGKGRWEQDHQETGGKGRWEQDNAPTSTGRAPDLLNESAALRDILADMANHDQLRGRRQVSI